MRLSKQTDIDAAIALAATSGKEIYAWADSPSGFGIGARPSGSASFIFAYRYAGKPRKLTIGKTSLLSLVQALRIAKQLAGEVASGSDPAGAKQTRRIQAKAKARENSRTVEIAATEWLAHYGKKRKPSSLRQARTVIGHYVLPLLGQRPITAIGKEDAIKLLKSVPSEKAAMQRAVYVYSRLFFDWAVGESYIDENPVIAIPKAKRPSIPKARHRYLNQIEVKAFWQATASEDDIFRAYFRLLLATGQRREEVAGLSWRELDRANRIWDIPAARAKNDTAHIVHLNEPAIVQLDLIVGGPQWPSEGLVFSTTGRSPISGITKPKDRISAAMQKELPEIEHWRTHDLRRTLATHCGELGEGETIIELALNHKGIRAGLAGVYQKAQRLPERKAMLELWGAALLEIAAGKRPSDFRDQYGEDDLDAWRKHCENRREVWRQQWGEAARAANVTVLRAAL